jgi:hypothetical protein
MRNQINELQGASKSGQFLDSFAVSSTPVDPDNFPMVVWLRGDESYFNEFTLSTDAAMDLLKIRRSRLTQISGRELRVGRTRIDRYVRPVYRQIDIDGYLAWTRQTASHQKSANALKEAALILSTKSDELTEELLHKSGGIPKELLDQLVFMQRQIQTLLLEKSSAAGKHSVAMKSELIATIDDRYGRLSTQLKTLNSLMECQARLELQISALSNSMLMFMNDVQKFSAESTYLGKQQHQALAEQAIKIEHLHHLAQGIANSQAEDSNSKQAKFHLRRSLKKSLPRSQTCGGAASKFANRGPLHRVVAKRNLKRPS